jgi:ribulose 1,5-bisphosphate synthetase/thiazole synthase
MEIVEESARQTAVMEEADVIIAGGGPAGFAAAIAAARNGAKAVLIERSGFLGGLATGGLIISMIETHRYGHGICKELIDRLLEFGAAKSYPRPKGVIPEWADGAALSGEAIVDFDPEIFKIVADEMVAEAGVNLILYSLVVGSISQKNNVQALIIENKSGRQAILGKVIVDATGDGDVASAMGAAFHMDNHSWGIDLGYRFGGVDTQRVLQWKSENRAKYKELMANFNKKMDSFEINWERTTRNDIVWGEAGRITQADGLNVRDQTKVTLDIRKNVYAALKYFRSNLPGFESAFLMDTASQLGVRETRKIDGEYTLTREDVLEGREFDDTVTRGPFDIPYRCLIPKEVDGVLTAGRCISVTHEAHGNIRNIPPCIITGQVAGTAAALSSGTGVRPRDLHTKKLQKVLSEQGIRLGNNKRLRTLGLRD